MAGRLITRLVLLRHSRFRLLFVATFASGIGNTAHVVFLMRRSRSAFSASHYAFASAVVSLGSSGISASKAGSRTATK